MKPAPHFPPDRRPHPRGLTRLPQFLLLLLSLLLLVNPTGIAIAATAPDPWPARFTHPPADARILKIIHPWPDAPTARDQLIDHLQTQGFGGVVCNVSFDRYLQSDPHWDTFVHAVKAAKQAGFALWLYDERGYPSGNAGGLTLRDHPEWEARGLLATDLTVTDRATAQLELPPGQLHLARAFPLTGKHLDLAHAVDLQPHIQNRRLVWPAPEGRWKILVITEDRLFDGTHADGNLHEKIPYPNLLLAEPTRRFVELTYGGYARHLGQNLGTFFEATFTDEPSLMSLFLKPMPWRPIPWSKSFPAEFRTRRGYDLIPESLPALFADVGPTTARLRHDFWLTIGELVARNYFGQIQDRCRTLGVPSGGHLLAEEGLVGHVPLYGDLFRCIRHLDAPSIDCLTSVPAEVPWFIARLLASAAELEGRTLVMSETSDHSQVYRPAGDNRPLRVVSEAEIRGTAHRLAVAGINVFTSYYSFRDLPNEALRRLNTEIGRVCTAIRGGHQVADIAILYPIESVWTRFVPSRHWTREAAAAARIENLYRTAAEGLFAATRDFTFIDSRALTECRVEPATLVHGPSRWRIVVLPGVDTLPLAAWERLADFTRQGGVVIALGELPRHTETEFPSPRAQAIATDIFGTSNPATASTRLQTNGSNGAGIFLAAGAAGLLPQIINGLLEPDVKLSPDTPKSPLRATHRRIDHHEVYLLVNDGAEPWSGPVQFAALGPGLAWNPATGLPSPVPTRAPLHLQLPPYAATVIRFDSARLPQRLPLSATLLPTAHLDPTPLITPTAIRGEFVRADLNPDPAHSSPNRPVWRTTATLTKGQVDTFLFAQFHHTPTLNWTGVDHLELESWVPDHQTTPNQLLIILHEQGGGDFLVETGRSLAGPAHEVTFIPLDRFQLAGWSQDPDGRLDPARIQDIRIGWGGYLGTEGERVELSIRAPRIGRIGRVEGVGPNTPNPPSP